jgi:organic hydroperoxide reductase OsmC/OhrA
MVARVDGVDDAALQAAAARAHASCPFSQLLGRAGAEVSVTARLAD